MKRIFKKLLLLFFNEIRRLFKDGYPSVVNFNANDICNSKCTMCNIWQQKQSYEITPADLISILKDPLYRDVRHVGITGGEPTLRDDIASLYSSAISVLPKLRGMSIITNAIREQDVIQRIEEINNVCKSHKITFSMMVSLDGYGETHDRVRGREGNFRSAINVINHFKGRVPLSFGCTISKANVWDVDELLDFVKDQGLYGRFRVAEFIKRLYNLNRGEVIRNFSDDEAYHLALFFFKLERKFEPDPVYKKTYSNIRKMLLGATRQIGCPYQRGGVLVNSRGELAYCAPRSNIIGNGLHESSKALYSSQIHERKRVLREDCDNCIHDYHEPITLKEYIGEYLSLIERRIVYRQMPRVEKVISSLLRGKKINGRIRILIVGWYGTETVGDKAILGGIIDHYTELYKGHGVDISIGSLYPFVTDRTCTELKINADVFDSQSLELIRRAKAATLTVIGGGPLMDLKELNILLKAFETTKASGGRNVIFGCGLGPLYQSWSRKIVTKLIELADEVYLRDSKSIDMVRQFGSSRDVSNIGDPARAYISRVSRGITGNPKNEIACFLRELPREYFLPQTTDEEYTSMKIEFERFLSDLIRFHATRLQARSIRFYSMHNFVVGGDDRDYARYFIREYFQADSRVSYEKRLSTVETTIIAMKSSSLNICMRFHSVLFAHTLNTDFFAIDYTGGGKIANYLIDNGCSERMVKLPLKSRRIETTC